MKTLNEKLTIPPEALYRNILASKELIKHCTQKGYYVQIPYSQVQSLHKFIHHNLKNGFECETTLQNFEDFAKANSEYLNLIKSNTECTVSYKKVLENLESCFDCSTYNKETLEFDPELRFFIPYIIDFYFRKNLK
ncbi:MAG: hypothetical protein N2749_04245 [Clostridia bacterium]|nr:hypothetical protein [Clostridia bacterium]